MATTTVQPRLLPYICPACGYPMRAEDVYDGLVTRCTACDSRLSMPSDPSPRETVRLSPADLAAFHAQMK